MYQHNTFYYIQHFIKFSFLKIKVFRKTTISLSDITIFENNKYVILTIL